MPNFYTSLFDLDKNISRKCQSGKKSHSSNPRKQRYSRRTRVEAMCCDDDEPISVSDRVKAMAIDRDEPIELQYDSQGDRYIPTAMSFSSGTSLAPDMEGETEAFQVEAFSREEEPVDENNAQAFDWDEEHQNNVQALELEEEEQAKNPQAFAIESENEEAKSWSFDADVEKVEAEVLPPEETASEAFSQDDFMADLQAILKGEKTYDQSQQQAVALSDENPVTTSPPPSPSKSPPSPPEEAEIIDEKPHDVFDKMAKHMAHNQISAPLSSPNEEGEQQPNPQDIFDQLGESMAYANSFDLGSISLQQKFDEFDRILDKEETKQQAPPGQNNEQAVSESLALEDEELAEDLAFISKENSLSEPEKHKDETIVKAQNINKDNSESQEEDIEVKNKDVPELIE